jgi:hypothetical protein
MASNICTICSHKARHQIEIALVHKVPLRVIGKRHGCSFHALHRHRRHHVSAATAAAILTAAHPAEIDLEALRKSESEGLLSALLCQRARLQQQADMALELGSIHVAVAAERAITESLRLTAQLTDQLVQHHQVSHVNVLVSEDYLALRHALMQALRPHPAAARDVSRVLHALEAKAAEEIKAKANGGKAPLVIEHRGEVVQ